MTLLYVDVSNNNWSSVADLTSFLSQLTQEGFAGVAHKRTEGNYYQDPFCAPCQAWCASNGLPFIDYHYVTTNDAASQAANWQSAGGSGQAMMDWEANGGDVGNLYAVINAFNAVGVNGQICYGPNWYLSSVGGGDLSQAGLLCASGYPVSGADYASTLYVEAGGDNGEGWAPYGNATPAAWQFTDSAKVAGITVDANAYKGADIRVLFGTAPAAPVTPTPPVVTPPAPPVAPPPVVVTPPVAPVTLPTDDRILVAIPVIWAQFTA